MLHDATIFVVILHFVMLHDATCSLCGQYINVLSYCMMVSRLKRFVAILLFSV